MRVLPRTRLPRKLGGSSAARRLFTLPPITAEQVLRAQDPLDRIRFAPPPELSLGISWKTEVPTLFERHHPFNVQPYMIPFWTVCHLWKMRGLSTIRADGRSYTSKAQRAYELSYSIAAVENSHWCSGLITSDDCRRLAQRHLGSHKLTTSAEPFHRDNRFDLTQWDAERQPKFAKGYPRPSSTLMEYLSIACMPQAEEGERNLPQLISPVYTWAVPNYRLVYRVQLRDGTIGFASDRACLRAWRDLAVGQTTEFFVMPTTLLKVSPPHAEGGWELEYFRGNVFQFYAQLDASERSAGFEADMDGGSTFRLDTPSAMFALERVVKTTQRSELHWDDPAILPADDPAKPSMMTLLQHTIRCTKGAPLEPYPRYFKPALPEGAVPIAPRARSPPRPISRPLKQQASSRPPTATTGSPAGSTPHARRPSHAKIAQSPSPPLRPSLSTTISSLPDPRDFYSTLRLSQQATTQWLKLDNQAEADRKVKEQFYFLATILHPDAQMIHSTPETKEAQTQMFRDVQEARKSVGTLEGRLRYHEEAKGKP